MRTRDHFCQVTLLLSTAGYGASAQHAFAALGDRASASGAAPWACDRKRTVALPSIPALAPGLPSPISQSDFTNMSNAVAHHDVEATNGTTEAPQLKGGSDLNRQISVTLTPTQFEEMYLQPSIKVSGNAKRVLQSFKLPLFDIQSRAQQEAIKRFANPTPIGIVSFLLTYAPTVAVLANWRGTTSASLLALM